MDTKKDSLPLKEAVTKIMNEDTKNDPQSLRAEFEQEIFDSEAGLEAPHNTEEIPQYVDEETALRIEFEQAQKEVENSAEQRAVTPFQAAAMTHARMCNPTLSEIDRISGGAAKRILKYLIAYPFYVKELNAQDKQVEDVARICDKLVHSKFTMAMCQAIEKEIRTEKAVQAQEALIMPIPEEILTPKKEE